MDFKFTNTKAEAPPAKTAPGFWDAAPHLYISEVLSTPAPELDFVLPGLKSGSVGALVSAGGTGKSALALQLAATVACGIDMLRLQGLAPEWKPATGRVIYLSAEDPADVLARRIHSLASTIRQHQGGGEALHKLAENMEIRPLTGLMPDLMDDAQSSGLIAYAQGAKLIIIDTLRRFHHQDENDGGAMAHLLAQIEKICQEATEEGKHPPAVLFLHHTNKLSSRDGGSGEQQASRGSSVLTDNVRLQMNLSTMSASEAKDAGVDESCRRNFVRLSFPKVNYAPPMGGCWYRRDASTGGMLEPAVLDQVQIPRRTARVRDEA